MSERTERTEPSHRTPRRSSYSQAAAQDGYTRRQRSSSSRRSSNGSGGNNNDNKPPITLIIGAVVAVVILIALIAGLASCFSSMNNNEENTSEVATTDDGLNIKATARTEEERKATSKSNNQKKPSKHVCYLTFDDGPSENTTKILDILDSYGVKATWFVMGSASRTDLISEIWNRGNQIGIHTQSHDYTVIYSSADTYWADFKKVSAIVQEQLGFEPTLFRFPGGSVNDYNADVRSTLFKQAKQKGLHYFDWNVSSGDASGKTASAKKLLANIKKESKGNNSCCVLMHDTEAKGTTVEALPSIIEYYAKHGYTFDVLLSDSFGYQF